MITIEAEPTDKIRSVTTKVESMLSSYMDVDQIRINFLKAKIQDPNDYCKDSTLNVMLNLFEEDMRIFVDETDLNPKNNNEPKLLCVKIDPDDTVSDVWEKIKSKRGTGIHPWKDEGGKRVYAGQWPCIGRLHGDGGILLATIFQKSPFDLSLLSRKGMLLYCQPRTSQKMRLTVEPNITVLNMKSF